MSAVTQSNILTPMGRNARWCPNVRHLTHGNSISVAPIVYFSKKKAFRMFERLFNGCGKTLSSRAVSSQVLWALMGLTSVFGMRTGGPQQLNHRNGIYNAWAYVIGLCSVCTVATRPTEKDVGNVRNIDNCISQSSSSKESCVCLSYSRLVKLFWTSARPISINQLNVLLHLHLWPINLVVYKGPYQKDILSLGGFHT